MKSITASQKKAAALFAGCLALLAAGRLISSSYVEFKDARASYVAEESKVEDMLTAVSGAKHVKERVSERKRELEHRKRNVLLAPERLFAEAAALEYLQSVAGLAGLDFTTLELQPANEKEKALTTLTVRFSFDADVNAAMEFLGLLESGVAMRVKHMEVKQSEMPGPAVSSMLNVQANVELFSLLGPISRRT